MARCVAKEREIESFLVGKGEVKPLPPRCREGVNSSHLPTCLFQASGDSAQSTSFEEFSVLTYAA